jgi:hypothetical protein
MHKQRGYKRDENLHLVRDYKLFAIVCEGSKREPGYFKVFQSMSPKIKVDVIENIVSDCEMEGVHKQKSAPKWVLDRAIKYVEKEGLIDIDELWFVMDVDRWSQRQLIEIADYCKQNENWHIVLSNPCFEVWLYLHKKSIIPISGVTNCQELKNKLSSLEKGGYHPYKFLPNLDEAIKNAKNLDTNPDHYFPSVKTTKVYLLCESILRKVGKSDSRKFNEIILPELIEKWKKENAKLKYKK